MNESISKSNNVRGTGLGKGPRWRAWAAIIPMSLSTAVFADIESISLANRANETSCPAPLILKGGTHSFNVTGDWMDYVFQVRTPDEWLMPSSIRTYVPYKRLSFVLGAHTLAGSGYRELELCYETPVATARRVASGSFSRTCDSSTVASEALQVRVENASVVNTLNASRPDAPFDEIELTATGSRLPHGLRIRNIRLIEAETIKADGTSGGTIDSSGLSLIRDNDYRARLKVRFADTMKKVSLRVEFGGGGRRNYNDCWLAFDRGQRDTWEKFVTVEVNPYAIMAPTPIFRARY